MAHVPTKVKGSNSTSIFSKGTPSTRTKPGAVRPRQKPAKTANPTVSRSDHFVPDAKPAAPQLPPQAPRVARFASSAAAALGKPVVAQIDSPEKALAELNGIKSDGEAAERLAKMFMEIA